MTAPLRIVLATDKSGYMAPIIPALTKAGARIVAHIAPPTTWRRRHRGAWRYGPVLARHSPGYLALPYRGKDDWPQIIAALKDLKPDLIVSVYFMAQIPTAALALARLGGVNLHPARLPWYAGAVPLHYLYLDGAEGKFGGVTLHVMAEAFDTGPIIAAATLPDEVWAQPASLHASLAGAASALCAGPLQDWIAGRIIARDQPVGRFPRATVAGLRQTIPSDATAARLERVMRFFRKGLAFQTPQGHLVVGPLLRRVGPPTGEAPQVLFPSRVRFDCADARIEARHPFRLERGLCKLTGRLASPRPTGAPIPPASILTADQNAAFIVEMAACNPLEPGPTSRT